MRLARVALQAVRSAKHHLWVASRAVRARAAKESVPASDAAYRALARLTRFTFEIARYPEFDWAPPGASGPVLDVPRRIFICWTGSNPMTPNRRRGLDSLIAVNPGVNVAIVTAENLSDWEVPEHPIHSSYEHLSLNHRSDYLRAYLLHWHGGGYADVKPYHDPWDGAFDQFDDPLVWLVGYPEVSQRGVAPLPGRLGRDLRRNFARLVGNGAFIARPRTPLTSEWLAAVDATLDRHADALRSHPGGLRGETPGYPLGWSEVQGMNFHPICLRYVEHVRQDAKLAPDFQDYL